MGKATQSGVPPEGRRLPVERGLRAVGKQASQDKIVMAARKLFIERGYDDATLRDIAKAAGLALATIFNHVQDKRDLIYLIFDEDVVLIADRAQAAVRPWQTFNQKVLTISSFYFQMFSVEPILSRILLSEVLQQTPGVHLERHLSIHNQVTKNFEKLAIEAQAKGELKPGLDAGMIARSVQSAFTGISRWWIVEPNPDWRKGQQYFEEMLGLLSNGYNLAPEFKNPSISKKPARGRSKKLIGTTL